jgi:hypothetical protein
MFGTRKELGKGVGREKKAGPADLEDAANLAV